MTLTLPASPAAPTPVPQVNLTAPSARRMQVVNAAVAIAALGNTPVELQYIELLRNAIQACQTIEPTGRKHRIIFDELRRHGARKLTIVDTGCGIPADRLESLIGDLYSSGKNQGAHSSFGVGAKISTLTHNPAGIEYLTLTEGAGTAASVILGFDANGEPGLIPFSDGTYLRHVPCRSLHHEIRKAGHGTQVILHGQSMRADTVPQTDGKRTTKYLTTLLNNRFTKVPAGIKISTPELSGTGAEEFRFRTIEGSDTIHTRLAARRGEFICKDGTVIRWWIVDKAKRKKVKDAAQLGSRVAFLYHDEAYITVSPQAARNLLGRYGITAGHADVTLHVVPAAATPTNDRLGLRIGGEDLNPSTWAEEFATNLPKALADHVAAETGVSSDSTKWLLEQLAGNLDLGLVPGRGAGTGGLVPARNNGSVRGAGSRSGQNKGNAHDKSTTERKGRPPRGGVGDGPGAGINLPDREWREEPDCSWIVYRIPATGTLVFNAADPGYQSIVDTVAANLRGYVGTAATHRALADQKLRRYVELTAVAAILGWENRAATNPEWALDPDDHCGRELSLSVIAARPDITKAATTALRRSHGTET